MTAVEFAEDVNKRLNDRIQGKLLDKEKLLAAAKVIDCEIAGLRLAQDVVLLEVDEASAARERAQK